MIDYLTRLIGAVSRFLNVLLFNGSPDESISARAHREGWQAEQWIDRAYFWQDAHCRQSFAWDRARAEWLIEQYGKL